MPTYEYECERCGHTFERFQGIMEPPVKRCPECKGKTRRLIGTGAGIIFKGSGFYETDYRSDSYKDAAKKEKTASTPAPEKKSGDTKSVASTKKDTKPESSTKTAEKGE